MKKSTAIKIALLAGVLVVFAVLLRTSSDILRPAPYDPTVPTQKKTAMLAGWLPESADLTVIADIQRLAEIPSLKGFLEEGLFKGSDTAIKTIRSLLGPRPPREPSSRGEAGGPQTKIGMIVMSAILGDAPISFFVIVQGDFREADFVDAIKKELAQEGTPLVSKTVGGVALYSQEGSEAPFAFALPDRNHLIVGIKESMELLFSQKPPKGTVPFLKGGLSPSSDSPFFGFLRSSERIKTILPPQFASLEIANFWADDQKRLHVSIECRDPGQAGSFKMFLLGMKALYILQGGTNKAFADALGSVTIGGEQNIVRVDAPLEQLPVIFSK